MAHGARMAERWWTVPPAAQATYLAGADPALLRLGLDPLPAGAPAVAAFHPGTAGPLADQVTILLDELDRTAIALYPRWLPGAESLDDSAALAVPAVRELAARVAARSLNFGPFLADLAERALHGDHRPSRFPAEVRARGLVRVIAQAYDRPHAALLMEVPEGLTPEDEQALVASAEWLSRHGRLAVWLAGAPLRAVDRLPVVRVTLPPYLTALERVTSRAGGHPARPGVWYPPLSGTPRRDSAAEQRLEKALARHEWAIGRHWNYTYQAHLLHKPYRLDLFWPTERVVVEVDGSDHREQHKYADDRRRDAQLQLLGHVVVRFTNEDVLTDIQAVIRTIERLLTRRRTPQPATHGDEEPWRPLAPT